MSDLAIEKSLQCPARRSPAGPGKDIVHTGLPNYCMETGVLGFAFTHCFICTNSISELYCIAYGGFAIRAWNYGQACTIYSSD